MYGFWHDRKSSTMEPTRLGFSIVLGLSWVLVLVMQFYMFVAVMCAINLIGDWASMIGHSIWTRLARRISYRIAERPYRSTSVIAKMAVAPMEPILGTRSS